MRESPWQDKVSAPNQPPFADHMAQPQRAAPQHLSPLHAAGTGAPTEALWQQHAGPAAMAPSPWQHPQRDPTTQPMNAFPTLGGQGRDTPPGVSKQWPQMQGVLAPEQAWVTARKAHNARIACTADSLLAGMPPLDTADNNCQSDYGYPGRRHSAHGETTAVYSPRSRCPTTMLRHPSGSSAPTRSSFDVRTSLDSRSAATFVPTSQPPQSSAPTVFTSSATNNGSNGGAFFPQRDAVALPLSDAQKAGTAAARARNHASYGSLLAFDDPVKNDPDEALLSDMLAQDDDTLDATRQPADPLASFLKDSISLPPSDDECEAAGPKDEVAEDDEWRPGLASEEPAAAGGRKRRRGSSKSAGAQDADSRRSRRRESNRESARRSRARKLEDIQRLEDQVRVQDDKMAARERELTRAQGEVKDLREGARRLQARHDAVMQEVAVVVRELAGQSMDHSPELAKALSRLSRAL